MKTLSTSELGIIERDRLERNIRFMARGLNIDLTGEVADITENITGSRAPLFLVAGDELQTIHDVVRNRIRVGEYVCTGESSFDRIRNASDDMLRVVAFLSDAENKPYENMAAMYCRNELERRGVRE